ncbi:MAG: GntR family transcriptional regulator [Oscillospiraceae bacterium]|nr:GntR family transcriptional regulator [Oscillospiraceae bacterium]
MQFVSALPIYLQIIQDIKQRIVSGEWQPKMRVPPVRELSVSLGVNPNTAQRALAELEREGLLRTERTSGRFITDDEELIGRVRGEMAEAYADEFLLRMSKIGFRQGETLKFLKQNNERGETK